MPFVTEEIWQALPSEEEALMVSAWPLSSLPRHVESIKRFENLQALTRAIRNVRAEYSVEPAKQISATIVASSEVLQYMSRERETLALLSRLDAQHVNFQSLPQFVEKAPEEIVRGVREKATELEEKLKLTRNRLDFLQSTVLVPK